MKKIYSVLVENRSGVLCKVAGLFSRRAFNIDSLVVGETDDPSVSCMTIVSSGDNHTLEQIEKQLNKKLDIIKVKTFDEPASMLDPLAELDQFARIRQRIGGRTGILISHRVGFARLADRIVVMEGGRVAEQGTHEELLAAGGPYARFFSEQAMWYEDEGERP